jgi:AraC-like DNA-binding protein
MAEMFAVDVVVNGGKLVAGGFDRPRVSLAHARRGDAAEHTALLGGVAAEFEQPRCEVSFRREDLDLRIAPPGQEPVYAFFERQLEERVRGLRASTLSGAVRDALTRASELRDDVSSLARRMHMSTRTLQRRLADERTSLREIVEDVRRMRAIQLLDSGRSIAEVAELLGFAETSAFHRAFRRWTGRTPQQHRSRPRE